MSQMTQNTELTLKQACRRLGCSPPTFVRWATEGDCNGKTLEAFRLGRRWYTTEEAIERFRTYPAELSDSQQTSRPPTAADYQIEQLMRETLELT